MRYKVRGKDALGLAFELRYKHPHGVDFKTCHKRPWGRLCMAGNEGGTTGVPLGVNLFCLL